MVKNGTGVVRRKEGNTVESFAGTNQVSAKGFSKAAASSNSTTSSKRSSSNNSNDSKKKLKIKAKETLINGEAEESNSDLSEEMDNGSTHE